MFYTIAFTVLFFAVAVALMAVGVMVSGRRLAGSCGGNPDSPACKCGPEKRQACRERGDDDEDETLARPGEERLMQLGRRADSEY